MAPRSSACREIGTSSNEPPVTVIGSKNRIPSSVTQRVLSVDCWLLDPREDIICAYNSSIPGMYEYTSYEYAWYVFRGRSVRYDVRTSCVFLYQLEEKDTSPRCEIEQETKMVETRQLAYVCKFLLSCLELQPGEREGNGSCRPSF